MKAGRVAIVIGAIAVVAAAALFLAAIWTPNVPVDAASATLAQTSSNASNECLDRVERAAGWLDLCWAVVRSADNDPGKDYYTLRVYGTASGSGTGIRWSKVRADLVGQPSDRVFGGWPNGTFDGRCAATVVGGPIPEITAQLAEICGHTVGTEADGKWSQSATWTCVGCVEADHSDHAVILYEWVGVDEGTIPAWSIGADFGA